ncbi:InlB B-repeat-containing protein, partial [Erysipelothrix anatis]|uniref:InlB B-repeat-containing protein n=1 Tax=Erysipelothrix anatis TaxID=2683713 RepID=UPI00191592D7
MKRLTSLLVVLLLALVSVPISAQTEAITEKFSAEIIEYVRIDAHNKDVVVDTDEAFLAHVKSMTKLGGLIKESKFPFETMKIFDYKGVEYFESLENLIVYVPLNEGSSGASQQSVKNLTKLPQNFIDAGYSVKFTPGYYSSNANDYLPPHILKSSSAVTDHRTPESYEVFKARFAAEMDSIFKQYEGPRVKAEVSDFDIIVDNFNWLSNKSRSFDLELTLANQRRFVPLPVHVVTIDGTKHYEIDIKNADIPDVLVTDTNEYRVVAPNEKTIGIDYETTKNYVLNQLGVSAFNIVAELTDGTQFTADQNYVPTDRSSDQDKFFTKGGTPEGYRGEIKKASLIVNANDTVKAKLEEKSADYHRFFSSQFEEIGDELATVYPLDKEKALNYKIFEQTDGLAVQSYYVQNDGTLLQNPHTVQTSFVPVILGEYDVTFKYDNGKSDLILPNLWAGSHIAEPETPVKAGSAFRGWYSDSALTTAWDFDTMQLEQDLVLYAKWEEVPMKLTFIDGTDITEVLVKYGTTVDDSKVPRPADKEGYYFYDWYTEPGGKGTMYTQVALDNVVRDQTYYAHYRANDVTVTFNNEGVETSVSVKYDEIIPSNKVPSTSVTGKTFVEWNTQADGNGDSFNPTQPVKVPGETLVVYAIYETNPVTVTFIDGTVSTPVVTKYNQAIDGTKVPATVKDGYTFKEWNTQEDGQGTAFDVASLITADQTVYAIYEANDVTVTFVDGTVSTPVVTKYNQAIDGTKVPATVKDGYTFK